MNNFKKILGEIAERERKYKPQFFFSNEQEDAKREICRFVEGMPYIPDWVLLDDGLITTYTEVIYDERKNAIKRHKRHHADSVYLGEGKSISRSTKESIEMVEKAIKRNVF